MMNEEEASKIIASKLKEATVALKEAMKVGKESGVAFTWQPVAEISSGWAYNEHANDDERFRYGTRGDIFDSFESSLYSKATAEMVKELGEAYRRRWRNWEEPEDYVEQFEKFLAEQKSEQGTIDLDSLDYRTMAGKFEYRPEVDLLEASNYWMPSSATANC